MGEFAIVEGRPYVDLNARSPQSEPPKGIDRIASADGIIRVGDLPIAAMLRAVQGRL